MPLFPGMSTADVHLSAQCERHAKTGCRSRCDRRSVHYPERPGRPARNATTREQTAAGARGRGVQARRERSYRCPHLGDRLAQPSREPVGYVQGPLHTSLFDPVRRRVRTCSGQRGHRRRPEDSAARLLAGSSAVSVQASSEQWGRRYLCGFAIAWKSSASSRIASSTPASRATSRRERPEAIASFTISVALS